MHIWIIWPRYTEDTKASEVPSTFNGILSVISYICIGKCRDVHY